MGIETSKYTDFIIKCDSCGETNVFTMRAENRPSKRFAVKMSNMQLLGDSLLCRKCVAELIEKATHKKDVFLVAKPVVLNEKMVKEFLEKETGTVLKPCIDSNKNIEPLEEFINNETGTYAVRGIGEDGFPAYLAEREMPACVGDIFHVKETWKRGDISFDNRYGYTLDYKAGGSGDCVFHEFKRYYPAFENVPIDGKWRSPVHMPVEAARIFLRITDIHLVKVQDVEPGELKRQGLERMVKSRYPWLWAYTVKKTNLF